MTDSLVSSLDDPPGVEPGSTGSEPAILPLDDRSSEFIPDIRLGADGLAGTSVANRTPLSGVGVREDPRSTDA